MKKKTLIIVGIAIGMVLMFGIVGSLLPDTQEPSEAPTPVPTVTFAPGKTEADIINEAALCRLLAKGYDAGEIVDNPQFMAQESQEVLQEYLDGGVGLSGLHDATKKLCGGSNG